jgi:hypothetical protein
MAISLRTRSSSRESRLDSDGAKATWGASHGGRARPSPSLCARRATATFSLKTGRISKVGLNISLCYVLYGVLVGNTEKTLYRTHAWTV